MGVAWFWTESDLHNGSETSVSSLSKRQNAKHRSRCICYDYIISSYTKKSVTNRYTTKNLLPTCVAPKLNDKCPPVHPSFFGPRHTGDFTHSMPPTNHPLTIKIWFNLPVFGRAETIDPISNIHQPSKSLMFLVFFALIFYHFPHGTPDLQLIQIHLRFFVRFASHGHQPIQDLERRAMPKAWWIAAYFTFVDFIHIWVYISDILVICWGY